ncbi:protein CHROMATIN REMODELING 35-like isoform X2 [Chenopodium quinoa]|uniref:protein CHROMATIN REMODELING 35-like isoform X2 n=1 Tax=Chenopodium quinoa TaxID=63459 RepID=UPI000B776956|nr:protein CHROMATIN REMODELING 35-like isoform X2 [Chenopodium quinoa]
MKRGAAEVCTDNYAASSKKLKFSHGGGEKPTLFDYSDPFTIPELLDSISWGKYGSVTKDVEALVARKVQVFNSLFTTNPEFEFSSPYAKYDVKGEVVTDIVDLDSLERKCITPRSEPLLIIESDDEEDVDRKNFLHFQEIALPRPPPTNIELHAETLRVENYVDVKPVKTTKVEEKKIDKVKDKGVYVGIEDELNDDSNEAEDEELSDMWKEMNFALESSKDVPADQSGDEQSVEEDEGCDHSYVLKDDIGYVCRVCGVIQRAIETIFDFQYIKAARVRSYRSDSRSNRENDDTDYHLDGINLPGHDLAVTEISAHPRHKKQMKPHQSEGFNFLLSNLITENPGGCILAHAPGSGKTFMIISFMQSFLAQYPDARPLVVLPKGILPTWKKEFQRWQVEDIPLLDFYSMKAENRFQQKEVLRQWVEQRSILFLGYKQFSTIVTGDSSCKATAYCQEVLLKRPSILILDEGHTPRNENTDVLHSLAKVQTPRKVVLSGTLYQNHVKEVFTILNLVRPKFLKLDESRSIKKRIMSRVQFHGFKKQLKGGNVESNFFDLVEYTLQQDEDWKRKEAVIKDLREMTSKVLHYYRGDFLDDLPGLVDFTVLLSLSPQQKIEVDKLNKREKTKFRKTSLGCAVYTHPKLKLFSDNNPGSEKRSLQYDAKIDELVEKIDIREGVKAKFFLNMLRLCESNGEKLLVFSQYLLPLNFLERLAVNRKGWSVGKEIFMICGDTSTDLRESHMEQFNNSPDARVFFGSIKACGEGISLVGASRIIVLDVHLNPSVSRQAIGRAFRPGQEKKVFVYRLIAADSPEEEDHLTCFKKEQIAKRWFEWNEYRGTQDFNIEPVDLKDCGDLFLESPALAEDVKALHRR